MGFKLLIILFVANSTPLLLSAFSPAAAGTRMDNGRKLLDGYPLLGKNKSLGGFLSGVTAGGLIGYLIGMQLAMSLLIALVSMLGDLFTSFIKRRLSLGAGETVYLFDHLFEGLFPLLLCKWAYGLSWPLLLTLLLSFIVLGHLGSMMREKLFRFAVKSRGILCIQCCF